jgi:hypothetical protein
MAATQQHLLLFGDQAVETLAGIQNLVRQSKTSTTLRRFLREATDVIHTETSKLAQAERKRFSNFTTIADLAEDHAKQDGSDDEVATILTYILRLGEMIT